MVDVEAHMPSDREYFEAILRERDKMLDERFQTQTSAIETATRALNATLAAFPEKYALKAEVEHSREELAAIRADHVQRHEFDSLRSSQAKIVGGLVLATFIAPVLTAVLLHELIGV